ncbi:MAG: class I SAM-dependent methyltransferase [Burkholderiales bacterium]|nr:MAG: class I SAM-dependent methyltransferase [Burkholderiales bacterium]
MPMPVCRSRGSWIRSTCITKPRASGSRPSAAGIPGPTAVPEPFEMKKKPRPVLIAALALFLAGCATTETGDETYRPWVGQHGKDVMWVPTLDPLVQPMLEAAGVTSDDIVYDLGSGDGKIPIWAARRFGARAVGIEYNADLVALARRNVERAGVSDRVRMIHGDIFEEDFSSATVLTLFLGKDLNLRLASIITKMRPGTRVVSNLFDMGDWEPDRVIRLPDQNPAYFWVVPARIEGEWEISGLPESKAATLRLVQRFQKIEGALRTPDGRIAPVQGRLDGARLSLDYQGEKGPVRSIVADVSADAFKGVLASGEGSVVSGRRIR